MVLSPDPVSTEELSIAGPPQSQAPGSQGLVLPVLEGPSFVPGTWQALSLHTEKSKATANASRIFICL